MAVAAALMSAAESVIAVGGSRRSLRLLRRQMQMGLRLREDAVAGVVDGVPSLLLLLSPVRAAMMTQSSSAAVAAGRDGLFPCAVVGDANGSPIDLTVVRCYFCSEDAAAGNGR
ncbi:hypothetical protein ACLOJK_007309 [Asimina triloba]